MAEENQGYVKLSQVIDNAKTPSKYYVYIACCANGSLYTGYTKNVQQRIAMHNAGRGGHYTRINRPVSLIAFWSFSSKAEALQNERAIKRLSPEQKLALVSTSISEEATHEL